MFVVSCGEIPTVLENKQMILHSSLEVSRFHIVTYMVKQYCNEADCAYKILSSQNLYRGTIGWLILPLPVGLKDIKDFIICLCRCFPGSTFLNLGLGFLSDTI